MKERGERLRAASNREQPLHVKKPSAGDALIDSLAAGFANISLAEQDRALKAGDDLVTTRRALLSKQVQRERQRKEVGGP